MPVYWNMDRMFFFSKRLLTKGLAATCEGFCSILKVCFFHMKANLVWLAFTEENLNYVTFVFFFTIWVFCEGFLALKNNSY